MTKKEYMKKLAYQLRRLPKEDFDKAMDYFEEYFEDAGIENEQKAIEDLGAPEEAASALILDLAQENAVKPPKTMKRRFSALWIAILALCDPDRTASGTLYPGCARIPDPWNTCSRWRYLSHCTCRSGRKRAWHHWRNCDHPSDSWGGLVTIGLSLMLIGCGILVTYFTILLARWIIIKLAGLLGKLVRRGGRRHEEK